MSDFNEVTLSGRVSQTPSVYENAQGKIVRFSIASAEQYKVDGEFKERVTFNSIAVYDKFKADTAATFQQGDQVLLRGSLETHSYQKDGETRYSTEVALRPGCKLMKLTNAKPKAAATAASTAKEAAGKRPEQTAQHQPR